MEIDVGSSPKQTLDPALSLLTILLTHPHLTPSSVFKAVSESPTSTSTAIAFESVDLATRQTNIMPRSTTLTYPKTPINTVNRYDVRETYDLAKIHSK